MGGKLTKAQKKRRHGLRVALSVLITLATGAALFAFCDREAASLAWAALQERTQAHYAPAEAHGALHTVQEHVAVDTF